MGTILLRMRRHLIKAFVSVEKYVPLIFFFFLQGFGPPDMEIFSKPWNRIPDLGLELASSSQVNVRVLRNTALTSVKFLQNPHTLQKKRKQGRKWTSGRCFGIAASPGTPHGMVPPVLILSPSGIIRPEGGSSWRKKKMEKNLFHLIFPI